MAKEFVPYQGPAVTLDFARSSGLRFYFTGLPCAAGHIDQRSVSGRCCRECGRIKADRWRSQNTAKVKRQSEAWHAANREKSRAYNKAWGDANKERKQATSLAWSRKNADRHNALRAKWLTENKSKRREWLRQYRIDNRDVQAEQGKAWRAANREASNAIARNRRARIKAAEGSHSAEDVSSLNLFQKGKCAWCGKRLGRAYHVDHIYPIAKGGRNDRRNLQILCAPCNLSKSSADPIEWAQNNGRLL